MKHLNYPKAKLQQFGPGEQVLALMPFGGVSFQGTLWPLCHSKFRVELFVF